jgi:hypothetical protein
VIKENSEDDLVKRFPNYGWKPNTPVNNRSEHIVWPNVMDTTIFGRPFIKFNKVIRSVDTAVKFYIPIEWWEPIVWWFSKQQWSAHGLGPFSEDANKAAHRITWLEMMLLFQIQTGYRLDPKQLDTLRQEHAFRTAATKIFSLTKFRMDNKAVTSKAFWAGAPFINAAKVVIGHARAGLCRRPIIDNSDWAHVVRCIIQAHEQGNTKETIGHGFNAPLRMPPTHKWIPSVLYEMNIEIEKRSNARKNQAEEVPHEDLQCSQTAPTAGVNEGPCHFGHQATSGRRAGRVFWHANPEVSFWPGRVTGNVTLCSKCYQMGYRMRTRGTGSMPTFVQEISNEALGCPRPGTSVAECKKLKHNKKELDEHILEKASAVGTITNAQQGISSTHDLDCTQNGVSITSSTNMHSQGKQASEVGSTTRNSTTIDLVATNDGNHGKLHMACRVSDDDPLGVSEVNMVCNIVESFASKRRRLQDTPHHIIVRESNPSKTRTLVDAGGIQNGNECKPLSCNYNGKDNGVLHMAAPVRVATIVSAEYTEPSNKQHGKRMASNSSCKSLLLPNIGPSGASDAHSDLKGSTNFANSSVSPLFSRGTKSRGVKRNPQRDLHYDQSIWGDAQFSSQCAKLRSFANDMSSFAVSSSSVSNSMNAEKHLGLDGHSDLNYFPSHNICADSHRDIFRSVRRGTEYHTTPSPPLLVPPPAPPLIILNYGARRIAFADQNQHAVLTINHEIVQPADAPT